MDRFWEMLSTFKASLAHRFDAIIHSGFPQIFWVRPKWSQEMIPDQRGKVVIVTGGNSGIGYATCKALYDKNATVYLACRDKTKADEAIAEIERGAEFSLIGNEYDIPRDKPSEGRLIPLELDLADLDSIDRFVKEFKSLETHIDALYANAGVMASPEGLYTKQGYTLQFGTNCLGHHYLISLLLPTLLSSHGRIIISTSFGHSGAPSSGVDYRSVVQDPSSSDGKLIPSRYERQRWVEYGQSKWGNIATAQWLDWHHGPGKGGIISAAVHPGAVASNLSRHLPIQDFVLKWAPWIVPLITMSARAGAINQLWIGTCPEEEARELSGKYITPFQHIGIPRPDLKDRQKVEALWDWCEAQTRERRQQ